MEVTTEALVAAAEVEEAAPVVAAGKGGGGEDEAHDARDATSLDEILPFENIEKLFDDKIAVSEEYKYNGNDNGDRWRTKIRGTGSASALC